MNSLFKFARTWREAVLRPRAFFSVSAREQTATNPLLFAVVVAVAAAVANKMVDGMLLGVPDAPSAALGAALGTAIIAPFGLLIRSAIAHAFFRAMGGRTAFRETFACLSYATAPLVCSALPFVGELVAIVGVWVVGWFGLRTIHKTSAFKATIVVAFALALPMSTPLLMRTFAVEAFKIPARSMTPTLEVGDHIFANKLAYLTGTPSRGEVVVFWSPEHPDQAFVKRVIAVGGDRLEVVDGRPIINGWSVPRCSVGEMEYRDGEGEFGLHQGDSYVEYLGDMAYLTFHDRSWYQPSAECEDDRGCRDRSRCVDHRCFEVQGPWVVPAGEIWVMGDNRNNSYDSRLWAAGSGLGVPLGNVLGRGATIWMSFGSDGALRPRRIGISLTNSPSPATHPNQGVEIASCLASRPLVANPPPP